MDGNASSSFLPENIDDFFNYPPTPFPLQIFQDEYNQAALLDLRNDTHSCKVNKRKSAVDTNGCDEPDHKRRKKIMHRDFEKKRRQEMAALYKTLRSLMPLQYLKGRSVSDHMQGVVSFIQQMQKKVEGLTSTRDSLRKTLNREAINGFSKHLLQCTNQCIKVEVSKKGVQVIISTGLSGEMLLSRVLDVLNREGLVVVSSISTLANENMLHIIESQINTDGMVINPLELQTKLANLVF